MLVAAATAGVVATVSGMVAAFGSEEGGGTAKPPVSSSTGLPSHPAVPTPEPSPTGEPASPSQAPDPSRKAGAKPSPEKPEESEESDESEQTEEGSQSGSDDSARLYRHPESQVLDWVRDNPDDPRSAVIESRIGDRPAAVWFTDPTPSTVTSQVAKVVSGGAEQGRVPVLVAYAIPDRDCGGASQGGAADLDAYDAWIDAFAAGLGSDEVIVILEPDAIAQSDCLSADARADRLTSLVRAGRVMKKANPEARVYYDAGHSEWNTPQKQATLLRLAGAASPETSDGIFSNVSNFNPTEAEVAYTREVLEAMNAPESLGAVVDTSRNGNGAPSDGAWCDPTGRGIGEAPTLTTGEPRIDGYLWVKLPGESDGCRGKAGAFSPGYAYELAKG
ncbi:glycoside hydrolase family 6 protein [Streptomyces sp. NPDC002643]